MAHRIKTGDIKDVLSPSAFELGSRLSLSPLRHSESSASFLVNENLLEDHFRSNSTMDKLNGVTKGFNKIFDGKRTRKAANLCRKCRHQVLDDSCEPLGYEGSIEMSPYCDVVEETTKTKRGSGLAEAKQSWLESLRSNSLAELLKKETYDLKAAARSMEAENGFLLKQLENLRSNVDLLETYVQELMETHADLLEENERLKAELKALDNKSELLNFEQYNKNHQEETLNKTPQRWSDEQAKAVADELEMYKTECKRLKDFKLQVQSGLLNMINDLDIPIRDEEAVTKTASDHNQLDLALREACRLYDRINLIDVSSESSFERLENKESLN